MTEKNYNPEQKHAKATNKMEKMDKNISKKNEQKIADAPKEEIKKEQTEKTIEETKKVEEVRDPYKYGGLDVDFYTRARKLGYKINCLPNYTAYQFELIQLGEKYDNNGLHVIRQV